MQLPSPHYYLIKTKTNITYYFHLKNDKTIAIKTFTENNIFLDEEALACKPVLDFSVTIDKNDFIHLICITLEGNLIYYIHQKDKWKHRQISTLDIKSNHYRNLLIITNNENTHLLCNKTNLTNPGITSIEHMYWNNQSIKKTTVTTYLPGKYPSPFQMDIDNNGNIHIIYKVLHQKNNQLYYSCFNLINKKWSNGEIISNLNEDHSHPHMLIDKQDNLHLVWCTIEDNNFTLKYKRRVDILDKRSKWSSSRNISDKNSNTLAPLLLQDGLLLKIFSKQNNRINIVYSEDLGSTWSTSQIHKSYCSDELLLLKYSTNNDFEKSNTSITHIYGSLLNNSISVIGTNLFQLSDKKESPPASISPQEETPSAIEVPTSNQTLNTGIDEVDDSIKLSEENKTLPSEIALDTNIKVLVQEVQSYISKMALEVEKLEDKNKASSSPPPSSTAEDPSNSFSDLQKRLISLNNDLISIETEHFELQKQLDDYQKKIYTIEDRMIYFKRQLLEFEDQIMKTPSINTNLIHKIKNIFK